MTVTTQNPTSTSGSQFWYNPANAYSSNNVYAMCSFKGAVRRYFNYGFDGALPEDINILKVEVGLEFYCLSGESLSIRISVDNGLSWSDWSAPFTLTSEETIWIDVTSYKTWTKNDLLDANFLVEVKFDIGGGTGCYPNNMYLVVTENPIVLGKKNDELLDFQEWEYKNPEEIRDALNHNKILYALTWTEKEGWFVDERSIIDRVEVHAGTWTLYDVYSGEVDISYTHPTTKKQVNVLWTSHLELSDNHPRYYSLDGKNWILGTSEEVYNYWNEGKTVYINHLWYNYTLKSFKAKDVKVRKFTGLAYNVYLKGDGNEKTPTLFKKGKTLTSNEYKMLNDFKRCGVPISKFPPYLSVSEKEPWTAYLDWIPTRVTWSEAPPPPAAQPHSGTLLSPGIFSLPNQHLKRLPAKLKLGLILKA